MLTGVKKIKNHMYFFTYFWLFSPLRISNAHGVTGGNNYTGYMAMLNVNIKHRSSTQHYCRTNY